MDLKLKHEPRTVRPNQRIHQSVLDRMQEGVNGDNNYAPAAAFHGQPISSASNPAVEPWGSF